MVLQWLKKEFLMLFLLDFEKIDLKKAVRPNKKYHTNYLKNKKNAPKKHLDME